MLKAFKYRLYPKTEAQKVALAKHFGCVRFVYNKALEINNTQYKQNKKSISIFDLKKQITQLKKQSETQWLSEVNSQSLQQSVLNLGDAFQRFFKKQSQFPRFKSKHSRQSFSCPQNVKIDFHNSTVRLPKIGEIKCRFSREFTGKIKTCVVSKTPTRKYFISILVENPESLPEKPTIRAKTTIGIDLGIKDFAILSDNTRIENPKHLRSSEKRLQVLQRRVSKKKKGSHNKKKANLKVAEKHEKITNQRNDFLHKLSTKLIRENQTICLETLNISGMMKNHKLAKSIAECSWSRFVEFLKYKADWYGVNIVQIGRFEPSSKMCSVCSAVNKGLTLKHRKWKCLDCGTTHDRDVNAAINIKNFALKNTGSDRSSELVEVSVSKPGPVKQESTSPQWL